MSSVDLRRRLGVVPSLVAIGLAAAGLYYRHELVQWFSVVRRAPDAAVSSAAPSHADHAAQAGADAVAHYTCSMHPSVRSPTPGQCPICGMDLTPVRVSELQGGTVVVDAARRERIGMRTTVVEQRALNLELRAVGTVRYDETRLYDVNLRIGGWVRELRVDQTGQRVQKGQTLFTLYSPELYAAQREYLAALAAGATPATAAASPPALAQAARERLRLMGMTDVQLDALSVRGTAEEYLSIGAPASGFVIDKTIVAGARVEPGVQLYRVGDLGKVWVEAEIFEADLPHVHPGLAVTVELPHVPGASYAGVIDYVYPALQGETRTGRARIVLDNPKLDLKPDMFANVRLQVPLGEKLVVPESAVIYTGPRRLVFVDRGGDKLDPREVKLGVHSGGVYEVLEGLKAGEQVVSSGNFLIAAESRIRSEAAYWEDTRDDQP